MKTYLQELADTNGISRSRAADLLLEHKELHPNFIFRDYTRCPLNRTPSQWAADREEAKALYEAEAKNADDRVREALYYGVKL